MVNLVDDKDNQAYFRMLDGGFRHFGEESEDERNQLLTDLFPHFFKVRFNLWEIKSKLILEQNRAGY